MLEIFWSFFKAYGPSSISPYFALFGVLQDAQSRAILACGIILAVIAGAPLPVIGVIFSKIINEFPPSSEAVEQRIYQLLAVAIAYFAVTWGWALCWGIIGLRVSRRLRISVVDRALGLDQTYYETECPDITSRLTVDAQAVQSGTAEKVGILIQSISYFIVSFVVGFVLNARLTGILFAAVIPTMTLVVVTGIHVLGRFNKQVVESTIPATAIAESAIKAVQVVQAFDAFESLTADHRKYLNHAMRIAIKKAVAGAALLGSILFIAYAANALAFWQGSRIASQTGNAGTVYAIVFLILDSSFVIGAAGPFIQFFSQAASAGSRMLSVINHPKIAIDVFSKEGIHADSNTLGPQKKISFEDVSFAYPARPQEIILNSVNFEIKTGTTVGIVGASGSGKSTIAALLLRLYDPTKGIVRIDDLPIPDFNLASLRSQIALVDQDPVVFSGTIYSNIRDGYRGPKLAEKEMRDRCIKAAKAADAWSFIILLPDELDTRLGERSGTKLSGGQKQRICLARALVGDPALLVLDEATSALDTISEASILSSLSQARSGENRTTVMIAHRLAYFKTVDNIICMEKGQILEQGSHQELIARTDGIYRKLVEAQKLASDHDCNDSIVNEDLAINRVSEDKHLASKSAMPVIIAGKKESLGTLAILRRCLSLSRARFVFTLLALLGSLTTGALILGESVLFGHLVQSLNDSAPSSSVNFFSLMFLVVAAVALCGYITSGSCFGIVSEHLIMKTRDISLQTILRQDMGWFLKPGRSTSALSAVITMDSGHLSGLSGVIIGTITSALVSVIGGAVLAHVVAWKIAIVLFATSPILISAGFLRFRVLAKVEERNQLAYTEAASLATEACSSLRTISALGTEAVTVEKFHAAVNKCRAQTFRDTALGNLLLAFSLSITYFVYALAYWWGSKQVRYGEYTTLQFFIVLPAILFSAQAAGQLFSLAPDIGRAKGAASRVFALHDQKPTIDSLPGAETPMTAVQVPHVPVGTIQFKSVSLVYESRPNTPVFTNLNMTIKTGETVAIVGRSGAGKTSIISLLERFYDTTSGSILLDGIDIKTVPVSQHRAKISLVPQEPDLFSGSVAFNVGIGARPGHVATRDEIIDACKAVGIHEFVISLPDGYDTQCGTNGSQLSGGQKQRVAIARAHIRNPEILLLDEATSALDSNSETQIQEAISAAAHKRTTIIIAHRLTSVQKADRILVFDRGRILEEGRHDDLIRGGGIYEQMFRAQNL